MIMEREQFKAQYEQSKSRFGEINKVVVAVKLPTGATEIIVNSEQVESKIHYYLSAYDDGLRLKSNGDIQIVGFMFV